MTIDCRHIYTTKEVFEIAPIRRMAYGLRTACVENHVGLMAGTHTVLSYLDRAL